MRCLLLIFIACLLFSACSHGFESKPINIVFVCQHGYAKSLVAALHFERKAASNGLNVHVVARGLTPTPEVAPAIVTALGHDGFDVSTYRPVALAESDIATADRIITFAVDVPDDRSVVKRIDDVPPLSEDYNTARNRIVAITDALLVELLAERHLIETD